MIVLDGMANSRISMYQLTATKKYLIVIIFILTIELFLSAIFHVATRKEVFCHAEQSLVRMLLSLGVI